MEMPLTPIDFARRARRLYAERGAVVDGNLRMTYAQFLERCARDKCVIAAHLAAESVALRRQSPLKRRIYGQERGMRSAHRRSCPVLSVHLSGGDVWRKRIRAAAKCQGFSTGIPGQCAPKN